MRPIYLKLKGFTGIRAGMGLDEIEIDFSSLPDGVVAFSAPNGTGKTTIMENLTPYRIMPFRATSYSPRAFSFYEHTYGDAVKELVFRMNGTRYKSLVFIEATKKKQEAYLYIDEGGEWKPLTDGKAESYDEVVETLLGNPELFFMSVFRAQNAKSLTAYSKGDIKDIFTELLGIDHLKRLSEKAGIIRGEVVALLDRVRAEKSELTQSAGKSGDIEARLAATAEAARCLRENATATEAHLTELQASMAELQARITSNCVLMAKRSEIIADLDARGKKVATLTAEADRKRRAYERDIAEARERITALEQLSARLADLDAAGDKMAVMEERTGAVRARVAELQEAAMLESGRIIALNRRESDAARLEKELQSLQHQRERLARERQMELDAARREEAKLNNDAPCGGGPFAETCVFVKSAVEAIRCIPELEAAVAMLLVVPEGEKALAREIEALKGELRQKEAIRKDLDATLALKGMAEKELKELEKTLAALKGDIRSLEQARTAAVELVAAKANLDGLFAFSTDAMAGIAQQVNAENKEIGRLQKELGEIAENLDAELEAKKEELLGAIAKGRTDLQEQRTRLEATTREEGTLLGELERAKDASRRLLDVGEREHHLAGEATEWSMLEKALGNDGIIALEISDAGPQITTYANELLKVIGGRFSVKIETQFVRVKGGTKEGFDIVVYDSRTNEAKSLKLLSGGEKTWVEEAITRAICLYRASASGIRYECLFSDEKDGALDSEKKREFFDMKQRVLELGGYRNEFCITQTDTLLAKAAAVVELLREPPGINIVANA